MREAGVAGEGRDLVGAWVGVVERIAHSVFEDDTILITIRKTWIGYSSSDRSNSGRG